MVEILVQCAFGGVLDPPRALDRPRALDPLERALACLAVPAGVEWRGAAVARDGRRAVLWLAAPRVRAIAAALASLPEVESVWVGRLDGQGPGAQANVLVESAAGDRPEPASCLGDFCRRSHRVRLVRSLVSGDGAHALRMYQAPDAESVRQLERREGRRVAAVWACAWLALRASPAASAARE